MAVQHCRMVHRHGGRADEFRPLKWPGLATPIKTRQRHLHPHPPPQPHEISGTRQARSIALAELHHSSEQYPGCTEGGAHHSTPLGFHHSTPRSARRPAGRPPRFHNSTLDDERMRDSNRQYESSANGVGAVFTRNRLHCSRTIV